MGRIIPEHFELHYKIKMVPADKSDNPNLYNEEHSIVRGITKEAARRKLDEHIQKLLGNGVWEEVTVLSEEYSLVDEQEVEE